MPAPTARNDRRELEDEDLEPLPPLDGDAGEEVAPDADAELEEEKPSAAGLDDATGEDDPYDPAELGVDEAEAGWLNEPADAPDLDLGDVGVAELEEATSAADDAEEPGTQNEDFGFGRSAEQGDLDAGDEGPIGPDEELREADLPELDADEEGNLEDAALVDDAFGADEPAGLPWAAAPWSRAGAPVALVAAWAVACADRGALACGRGEGGAAAIVRVDLEGTTQPVATAGLDVAGVRGLAVEGARVAAVMQDGGVRVSSDGGTTYAPLEPVGVVPLTIDAAWGGGSLWMRTSRGELRVAAAGAVPVEGRELPGRVVALAPEGAGGVAAMVLDESVRAWSLVHLDARRAPVVEPIEAPPVSPGVVAVRGPRAACAAKRGVVVRGPDGVWTPFAWEGRVTALAFVDDAGTLVAATYSDVDDTTALVRLDPGTASARIVARIGPAPAGDASTGPGAAADGSGGAGGDPGELGGPGRGAGEGDAETGGDGRVVALAFDELRGVVWVAGGFGVAAYAVR
jgi:hypothetical protein